MAVHKYHVHLVMHAGRQTQSQQQMGVHMYSVDIHHANAYIHRILIILAFLRYFHAFLHRRWSRFKQGPRLVGGTGGRDSSRRYMVSASAPPLLMYHCTISPSQPSKHQPAENHMSVCCLTTTRKTSLLLICM
jgi:hypothetical protein